MFSLRILEEGTSQAGVGLYVWVALIIFFLMVFLGWLVASRGWLKKEDEVPQSGSDHEAHAEDAHAAAPERGMQISLDEDLTIIEGIGPKVAKLLAGIGITTFEGLANSDHDVIRKALDGAGYKYMEPASWFAQAGLAAKGDMEGLKKMQDELKGGRKVA